MINSRIAKCLAGVKSHSPRILQVNFTGNPACTVIVAYAPTSQATEEDTDEFYNVLQQATSSVPAHNCLIVVADLNAKVGKDQAPYAFNDTTNLNGERLIDFVQENNLLITNTRFRKRDGKLWTWLDPTGGRHQIDYILVRRKWQNSVKNVEAYNTFSNVGSDHRIVTMRFKLSLRSNQNPKPKDVQHDWKTFCVDPDMQAQYNIEVKNRYGKLAQTEGDIPITEQYEHFIQANREATLKVIPKRKKVKGNPISGDIRVQQARENVKVVYNSYVNERSEEARIELKEAKANLANAYDTAKTEMLNEKLQELQETHDNAKHCKSWQPESEN